MTKATITISWLFAGKTYLPGEHDFPPDAHKALAAKGAFGDTAAPAPEDPGVGQVGSPDPLADAVGQDVAGALRAAGFATVADIAAASDDALRQVDGVGDGRLRRLRALAPAQE